MTYYDPSMTGFHGQIQYPYVPATYVVPAPTMVESKTFVVEPAGKLTKSEQLKKHQDAFKALSDKVFAVLQAHKAQNEASSQEFERFTYKTEQDFLSHKQQYEQILSKAALKPEQKAVIDANLVRLYPATQPPTVPQMKQLGDVLRACTAAQQLPPVTSDGK